MNAIEIRNINKSYDGFAIRDLNLTLPKGTIMGLVGKNGAGKSTVIKMILDIVKSESGSISVMGKDCRLADKEDIGVVMDETGFPGCLTPVQVEKIMKNIYKRWDSATFKRYIRHFNLPENKMFEEFSKGMKMKLCIAVAMSHQPKLLVLDEATSGLDPVVRDEILDIFTEVTRDEEHTILISSHIVSDLEKICDYIAFIRDGKLMLCEEKDRITEKYGIIHCTEEELHEYSSDAVIGVRKSPYGIEAVVDKNMMPAGIETGRVGIEDLFIFMSREAV